MVALSLFPAAIGVAVRGLMIDVIESPILDVGGCCR